MSMFDDFLADLAGKDHTDSDDVLEVEAEPVLDVNDESLSATQRARIQLQDGKRNHTEGPDGVFRCSGVREGCGYAEVMATVDDESATVDVFIRSGLYLSPENVKVARKICRKLNQSFIVEGLNVSDAGELVFAPEPQDMRPGGADLDGVIGKGLTTIRRHAYVVEELEAGRDPFDVLKGELKAPGQDGDDDDDTDPTGGFDLSELLARLG